MAGTSSLFILISVILSVSVSAYRPLVVEKYEAVAPSSPIIENNDVIDHVDHGKVETVNPNVDLIGGGIYPTSVPASGHEAGFQFQLGPIGFGASWNFGFPFPIFGPPFVVPSYTLPYYRPGSYLNPYELQGQSWGQGQLSGYAPLASSKGANSPSTRN